MPVLWWGPVRTLIHESDELAEELDPKTTLNVLSASAQERFEVEGVTEEDVDDAIAWARDE